jgi:cytosine/adenosine deaminase-related metal-dependent hydrolase
MSNYALKASWIVPVERPPIEGGVITIAGEKIAAVGENTSGRPAIDLGDAIILPGLVNAHTHLEFSDLEAPLGNPGISLPDWIRLVVAHRRGQKSQGAVALGLQECARHGTTTVGEIATPGWSQAKIESVPLDTTVFLELMGLTRQRMAQSLELARAHSSRRPPPNARWRKAFSPHAPYSTHVDLIRQTLDLIGATTVAPVAMHLAESREELEFLRTGRGPFRELLEDFGAWESGGFTRGGTIAEYLSVLAAAPRVLVIHGNYLTDDEIELVARHRDRMSVVYCPRTHDFFRHDPYPLTKLLSAGINVALGTDSRASNRMLSVLNEMRLIAATFPAIPPETIIRMGTLGGAIALGREAEAGSLTVGKDANFVIFASHPTACPYQALLRDIVHPVQTAVWGNRLPNARGGGLAFEV